MKVLHVFGSLDLRGGGPIRAVLDISAASENDSLGSLHHPHYHRHDRRCEDYPCAQFRPRTPATSEIFRCIRPKEATSGTSAQIGVDRKEGEVHWVCTSGSSVADSHTFAALLNG